MLWFIILIGFIIYFVSIAKEAEETAKKKRIDNASNELSKEKNTTVSKNYANEAINFFDTYLNLCKNHSVIAVCDLLTLGKDEFGIKTRMKCTITAIDNEHGDETFESIKKIWTELRQEKMAVGDYSAVTHASDSYIKQYFGCENPHYAFIDPDEYQFNNNGQVTISCESTLFTSGGARLEPTLSAIKQELQQKWPAATITIDKSCIVVKPH